MSSSERRVDTRVNVRVPLRFRVLNLVETTEHAAESENISQRGMFVSTDVPLTVGTPLAISLRMPAAVSGKLASDVRCVGRVVHVKDGSAFGGPAGVGVHIDRYEAKASARERWAS